MKSSIAPSQRVKSDPKAGTTVRFDDRQGVYFDGPAGDDAAAAYDQALYQPAAVARTVRTLDAAGDEDLRFYEQEGYLSVEEAFSPAEIQTAIRGLINLTSGRRSDYRQMVFEGKAQEILPRVSPEERLDYVRKLEEFVEFDAGLKAMAYHPKLLAVVRRMIGTDDIILFSNMALLKPPRLGREKPWHQDNAYYGFPLGTKVVGVWIALDEATVENGCMQLLPELRKRGAILHHKRRDWQICDTEVLGRRSVAAPLKSGGLLFFDSMLPHGTPENRTASRRRAVQFHYAPAAARKNPEAERLQIFGSEGKNVRC